MKANDIQIGGNHYRKAGDNQHWDKLPKCGWGWEYYVGRATAYLSRVKQPDEDPSKAGHFVDKLIELIDTGAVPKEFQTVQGSRMNCDVGRGRIDVIYYLDTEYFPANNIENDSDTAEAIRVLMTARSKDDLIVARERIARIEATIPGWDGEGPAAAADKPDVINTEIKMPVILSQASASIEVGAGGSATLIEADATQGYTKQD